MGCADSKPVLTANALQKHSSNKKFKIVLLGSSSVGKTTIALHYCQGSLSDYSGPTVGGVYHKKDNKLLTGQSFPLYIWDTAGQEKYRSMASLYYRDADVVILVFDLTQQRSFVQLQYWVGQLQRRIERSEVGVVVCGNKADLQRRVQVHQIEIWLKNYPEFMYAQVAALSGYGLAQMFQMATQYYMRKHGLSPYAQQTQ